MTDTILSALIAAFGGGIVSGLVIHALTQSRERERWILDSKKQEFKELITALALSYKSAGSSPHQVCAEDANLIADHVNEVLRIASDRVFITKDLDLRGLRTRWSEAVKMRREDDTPNNGLILDIAFHSISEEIIAAVSRAVPKTMLQRLIPWKR